MSDNRFSRPIIENGGTTWTEKQQDAVYKIAVVFGKDRVEFNSMVKFKRKFNDYISKYFLSTSFKPEFDYKWLDRLGDTAPDYFAIGKDGNNGFFIIFKWDTNKYPTFEDFKSKRSELFKPIWLELDLGKNLMKI